MRAWIVAWVVGGLGLGVVVSAILSLTSPLSSSNAVPHVFNVRDNGAVGDGITNDAPAIQGVLDAIAAHRTGTAYFPAGTYLIDQPYGLVLKGEEIDRVLGAAIMGEAGAVIKLGQAITRRAPGMYYLDVVYINWAHDVEVSGLTFQGISGSPSCAELCLVVHFGAATRRGTVSNNRFLDWQNGIAIDWSGAGESIITGNFIRGATAGILQTNIQGRAIIAHNWIEGGVGAAAAQVYVENGGIVHGNRIDGFGAGVAYTTSYVGSGLVIDSNWMTGRGESPAFRQMGGQPASNIVFGDNLVVGYTP